MVFSTGRLPPFFIKRGKMMTDGDLKLNIYYYLFLIESRANCGLSDDGISGLTPNAFPGRYV
jgi:hypothetical protein